MRVYVFISYGHDEYADRTRVLYEEIKKNDENFVIWWDNKLEVSDDWVLEIEKNLNNLIINKSESCFIYVITPHSANTVRENFCIKEIVKALGNNVKVVPVKLADAPIPLLIGNIQWIDFTDIKVASGNKEFSNRIQQLCEVIKRKRELLGDGKQAILMSKFEPCKFSLELEKHLTNYEAREWLLRSVKDWIEGGSKRFLLLLGGPGTGKTAFSIWMSYSELSQYVCAWHLCQYSSRKETCDLRNAVKSMAYYLATRIPAYYNNLEIGDIVRIMSKAEFDAATLFKELILIPLNQIENPKHPVVILIDALDEASVDNDNGLAEILFEYSNQLPKWLKIIITSRNDLSVTRYLKDISYVLNLDDMKFSTNNKDDINRYVERKLGKKTAVTDKIVSESGNNFLYAQLLCDTINEDEDFDVDDLPKNINVYYYRFLKRYFDGSDFTFGDHAYPLLSLVLASYEPLRKEDVYKRLHGIAGYWCKNYHVFNNLIKCFGPLLKETDGRIFPFHKSLFDWFLNEDINPEYSIDKREGLDEMIRWGRDVLKDDKMNPEDPIIKHFYRYLPQYMIEAEDNSIETLYTDIDFWEKRKKVIEVNLLLKTMMDELSQCPLSVRQRLFDNDGFFNVLSSFGMDLFNTGRYVNLRYLGYDIPFLKNMDDDHRFFALQYHYINEMYSEIDANSSIFEEPYQDHIVEAMVLNDLGQTYRKLGQLEKSATYYKRSLKVAIESNSTEDEIIYTRLNLSRILTLQCRNREARQMLDDAIEEFNSNKWKNSMQGVDREFSAQQLIRGVRYVELETENFSTNPNLTICENSLKWADGVYVDITKRDRYYANHLIGKILYKIKTKELETVDELIKECQRNLVGKYDGIRLNCVHSLLLLCRGQEQEALQLASNLFDELKEEQLHQIQRTELAAIIGYITKTDKSGYLSEEFHPWYQQVQEIIRAIFN